MENAPKTSIKAWILAASFHGFVSVALGAFAAHALKGTMDPDPLSWIETACRYEMYHALALLALLGLTPYMDAKRLAPSAIGFSVGVTLFSGSLDLMAFTGLRLLGAITPIGGLMLLFAWLNLFWLGIKGPWRLQDSPPKAEAGKY